MDWNAMAGPWLRAEAQTDAAHAPVLDELLRRAALSPGQHVLDIGPGAGISLVRAAEAVGPTGHVTGVEIAPPFAARARMRSPGNVTVIEADAQEVRFDSPQFDAAISLFGVMFFRDSPAAFANLRAAMEPGARMHLACWGAREANPYFAAPAAAAARVLGPAPGADPKAPGPLRFADARDLQTVLTDAGWRAEIDTVDLDLTPMGGLEGMTKMQMTIGAAAGRLRMEKEAGRLTPEVRAAVQDALRDTLGAYEVAGEMRVPAQVHFVAATA